MNGNDRRKQIIELLKSAVNPISGDTLAAAFSVSRQVIVQDIALLRANRINILSTNRGYVLMHNQRRMAKRVFFVEHDTAQIADELNTIVDQGGIVRNVMVDHEIYGRVTAPLVIRNRREVQEFVDKVASTSAVPLKILGDGKHYHTVEAESQQILDLVEKELDKKGYLLREPST